MTSYKPIECFFSKISRIATLRDTNISDQNITILTPELIDIFVTLKKVCKMTL